MSSSKDSRNQASPDAPNRDAASQPARTGSSGAQADEQSVPPAGPHAKPSLTDYEKTPGAGSLPDDSANESDPGTG